MRNLDDILKNTLVALYKDDEAISECLMNINFDEVNYKFKSELFSRISPEAFEKIDTILCSDEYVAYKAAIDQSALSCTQELAELIEFAYSKSEGGHLN